MKSKDDEDPDVILLSHVWFKKKRTGEEYGRQAHGIFLMGLFMVFMSQFVLLMMPSLVRENTVAKGEQRCSWGVFYWKCGGEDGTIKEGTCKQFYLNVMFCKLFGVTSLVALGLATILQSLETIRPGSLSIRYRFFLTPLTAIAGVCLLLVSVVTLTTWNMTLCGIAIGKGYQLAYGWYLMTLNSIVLFYFAYKIWAGNRPW
eukprot:TRINITY_DN7594_c1_g1_i1.p1 TRINITY_DN7594_c1_g1~~TRINITY_DN7594_c1_g1_i1.p1  ORF type:complete len:202 (+),score=33.63 TRINITY_DN7594_c1_g1_i1:31-636(+)